MRTDRFPGLTRAKRICKVFCPKKPKAPIVRTRKPNRLYLQRSVIIRAFLGTYGNKTLICEKLGITQGSLYRILNREGWENVREAYEAEKVRLNDFHEKNVTDIATQNFDIPSKLRASLAYLQAKHPEWKQKHTVEVGGNGTPIKVQSINVSIPIQALSSSIEVRRAVLETIEEAEKRNGTHELPGT
jgi:hypothetical protein